MKKNRIVSLLLILCLVLGMFVGCTADKGSSQNEVTDSEGNSLIVDEGDINDPFGE